ncbi:MAG: DUF1925 domain-containing protein [Treponema sp.]|nr:DUF1925 domain-containing protein [Treponema sp.]
MKKSTRKLQVILGSHIHVPYGVPEAEFERAYRLRLKPFVSALYKFPQIQGTLHYSGALLSWVDRLYPECTMSIDDLVSRKQVELLGGGFYEPQFSLIPLQDKIGQVEMFTTYLRKRFGKKPQGCWLPGFGWEQNFVGPLSSCGMAYTFLGEESFRLAGFTGADLYTPCLSEDQGKTIAVFPAALGLAELFAPGEEAAAPFLNALESLAGELPDAGSRVVSVFPDPCRAMCSAGEAELYWHCFFQGLADSLSRFEFTTPGRFIRGRLGLRRAYFPSSTERRYLVDFPEANGLYAKMMFSHMLINQLRGDKPRKQTAREELWKAQGYDTFCPTESGGIYRGDLRRFAYRSMLEAEKITRETRAFVPRLMNFDFDLNNEDEYLLQGERINCYIRQEGAGVFELDYLPRSWNYMDIFARCPWGQDRNPPVRRASFSDMIVGEVHPPLLSGEAGDIAALEKALTTGGGKIRRCYEERFQLEDMDKTRCRVDFVLPEGEPGPFGSIGMEKRYHLRKDTLTVTYTLSSREGFGENFHFIPVVDLSFAGDSEDQRRLFVNGAAVPAATKVPLNFTGVEILKFQDLENETVINLNSDKPFEGWIIPAYYPVPANPDVSPSYQSTCVIPLYRVSLGPGGSWTLNLSVKFTH